MAWSVHSAKIDCDFCGTGKVVEVPTDEFRTIYINDGYKLHICKACEPGVLPVIEKCRMLTDRPPPCPHCGNERK